jgi:hypothetical protein
MITAERKPIEEILELIRPYGRILLVGCNECVTVCAAGGRKEVGLLSSALQMASMKEGKVLDVKEMTLERQCDPEYVDELISTIDQADAVLSMACGCGVQEIARRFKEKPVFPAVNTQFMGASERQGVWAERCQGCGNCILGLTGGICPIARCSKRLLNGPCGGIPKWIARGNSSGIDSRPWVWKGATKRSCLPRTGEQAATEAPEGSQERI